MIRSSISHILAKIINFFRKTGIFRRLLCIMLFLCILPSIFITWYSYISYTNEIKKNTEQYLSLLVKNISLQVQEHLELCEQLARSFYSDAAIMQLVQRNEELYTDNPGPEYLENARIIEQRLWEISLGNRYIKNFQLVTSHEQYRMRNSDGEYRGAMLRDFPAFLESGYFIQAMENDGYPVWFDTTQNISLIYRDEQSSQGIGNTLTMTVTVNAPRTHSPLGVLMLNVDSNFFTHALTNYSFYGTGNTLLLTDNDVLAVLNPNVNAPIFEYENDMKQFLSGKTKGQLTQELNGRRMFICFQKVRGMEMYIAHVVDLDTLLEPAYQLRLQCFTLVLVLIFFCILIAYLTSLSIGRPLKSLLNSIRGFEKSWDAERCEISGNDELTYISRHFNQMADSTQKMANEIVQANLKQQALELSRVKAELNALQMQINPHFLYNTLDLIRWETILAAKGESTASRMIDRFSVLLRKSIQKGETKVPISQELEHIQAYIDVVNFGRRAKVQLINSIDFDCTQFYIPKLCLQPIVENAVQHAFGRDCTHPIIHLRGWRIGDNLILITITDNGCGMSCSALQSLEEGLKQKKLDLDGIGLNNVNLRLKLIYGDEYGISIESIPDTGTEISVRLPPDETGR